MVIKNISFCLKVSYEYSVLVKEECLKIFFLLMSLFKVAQWDLIPFVGSDGEVFIFNFGEFRRSIVTDLMHVFPVIRSPSMFEVHIIHSVFVLNHRFQSSCHTWWV